MRIGTPARAHRPPRSGWARVTVLAGALLMTLSGGTLVGATALSARYAGAVHQEVLLAPVARASNRGEIKPGAPMNMLLIGIDSRPGNPAGGARSDSIIIVHVPAAHDRAFLVSIPRDLVVDIPAGGGVTSGRVNAAYAFGNADGGGRAGGMRLLSETITAFSGIRFDAAAILDFAGFQAVVGALGGVNMCIDQRVVSIHTLTGGRPTVYEPGCRHLAPWQALDYVRQRYIDGGDYTRQRHQQQFLKAVLGDAMSSGLAGDPRRLDAVLRAAGAALTFDGGGVGPLDWAWSLRRLRPAGVTMVRTSGYGLFGVAGDPGSYQGEQLDERGWALLAAVRDDEVDQFVAGNPDLVNGDG